MKVDPDNHSIVVIKPPSRWESINYRELKEYIDLFYFLVWRDIKVLYAQTILGFSWAILNPLVQIIIFTVIFGKIAQINTDGIPYILYSTVAIIPWTYMAESMSTSSQSLVDGQSMLGKIYFPRVIYPITPIIAKLVDFGISLILLVGVLIFYQVTLTWNVLLLPVFFLMMVAVPAGIGMWLSALAIRYRDVKFAMPFVIRMLIYSAPILYSASAIPETYRLIYSFNPIVGVIEGYRAALLGIEIPWEFVIPGMFTSALIFISGAIYFRKMERVFVDVI